MHMKSVYNYKVLLAFVFALILTNCGTEPDRILYKGSDFVFLESGATASILESSPTTLKIPVKVSTPQSEDIDVSFEISADGAVEGIDYELITPSPITIEAGEYTAYIEVEAINNTEYEPESRKFDITITDVSNSSIDKQVRTSISVEVVNDDCPDDVPKIAFWVTNLYVEDVGFAEGAAVGTAGPAGSCGGVLVVTGDDTFAFGVGPMRITLAFTQDSENPTTGTVTVAKGPYFADADYSAYHYEATGVYDEETKEILLDYVFYRNTGAVWFTGQNYIAVP